MIRVVVYATSRGIQRIRVKGHAEEKVCVAMSLLLKSAMPILYQHTTAATLTAPYEGALSFSQHTPSSVRVNRVVYNVISEIILNGLSSLASEFPSSISLVFVNKHDDDAFQR